MLRKIMSVVLVLVILCTTGAIGYTAKGDDSNKQAEIKLLRPEENRIATSEKVILLSGSAKEGTDVILEVYSVPNIGNKNFDLKDIPSDENLTLILQQMVKVESLGNFAKEVELKSGLNKIKVYSKNDNSNIITRYVYVSEISQAKKALDDFSELKFSDTIKQLIKK